MMAVRMKPLVHLAVLQKFVYRLEADLTPETRKRLESCIATYTRLYVQA